MYTEWGENDSTLLVFEVNASNDTHAAYDAYLGSGVDYGVVYYDEGGSGLNTATSNNGSSNPAYLIYPDRSFVKGSARSLVESAGVPKTGIEKKPFISLKSPDGGEEFSLGQEVEISWNANISGTVEILLLRDNSLDETIATVDATDLSYVWEIPEEFDINGLFKVVVQSASESLSDTSSATFTVTNLKKIPQSSLSIESFSSEFGSGWSSAEAIDGDINTAWHNKTDGSDDLPSYVAFKLDQPYNLVAFSYAPRQDGTSSRTKEYSLEVSEDGVDWTEATSGELEDSPLPQRVEFNATDKVQYVRFNALSSHDGKPKASIAEFNLYFTNETSITGNSLYKRESSDVFAFVSNDNLSINLPTARKLSLELVSLQGRQILSRVITGTAGVNSIALPKGVARGSYIVKIVSADNVSVHRILIK